MVTSVGMGLDLSVGQGEVEALKAFKYPEISTAEFQSSASTEHRGERESWRRSSGVAES